MIKASTKISIALISFLCAFKVHAVDKKSSPLDLRDPFKRPFIKKASKKQSVSKYYKGGIYTNKEGIDGIPLEQIRIVGVLLGKKRRALAKVEGKENTFVIREGQVLGLDGAEVKGILPAGLVLVEKIKNVYGEFEYLETLIPIEAE